MIISTGMSTETEIEECVEICNPNVIMHTNSSYPSKINELNTILGWEILRIDRNKLLKETDKYMVLDYPNLSESKKNEWVVYRQLLRDLPLNANPSVDEESELINITWPQQPS